MTRALYESWNEKSTHRMINVTCNGMDPKIILKDCLVIAHGKSPYNDWNHSVLWLNGKIVHDPSPSQAAIKNQKLFAPDTFTILLGKFKNG